MHRVATCPPDRGFLVFLTGEEEITRCVALIKRLFKSLLDSTAKKNNKFNGVAGGAATGDKDAVPPLSVFPLFAALPQAQQLKALSFNKPVSFPYDPCAFLQ